MASKTVAFIGDLHFYDGVSKSHVDYYANCIDCMDRYTAELEANKPDYILLSGDIVGLSERVTRTRLGLFALVKYLKLWGNMCNGNLYAISGNHDYTKGDSMSDFDFLASLGIIKTAKHLDVNGLRVHCIDYGKEQEPIEFADNKHNVAFMHANLQVDGLTTWFHADEGIQLAQLRNLKGVELVICGHIHNPSPRMCSTSIEDESISLLYLGCAARPKRRDTWGAVHIAYVDCLDNGDVNFRVNTMKLKPCDEIFTQKALELNEGTDTDDILSNEPVVDIETLTKILDELSPALMGSEYDYRTQIKKLAGVDKAAAEMAIHYIDLADEQAKVV